MSQSNLSEMLHLLSSQGYSPLVCDTPVNSFDNSVRAGLPTSPGDIVRGDYILMPKTLLGSHPEFFITAQGDSMEGVGFHSGDRLRVVVDTDISDGDIVVADIDGDCTVKTYFRDEQNRQWLIPANDSYKPLLLTPEMNVRFYGKVVECISTAQRQSYRECMRKVRQMQSAAAERLSPSDIDAVLRDVSSMVTYARQWYAVFRAMVDSLVVGRDDYRGFVGMVERAVPDNACPPTAAELRRMAIQSFSKPVALWESSNAPVSNQRFYDYLRIARYVADRLHGIST